MMVTKSKLELVETLRSIVPFGEAVKHVKEKYALHVNTHGEYPNLHQFKYDQIDSPMKKQLVQESRGIILDSDNNWNPVAYPFEKFWNHHESRAAKIDWTTAKIWEKVDGSLMFMYWYNDAWEIASSGLPDASGTVLADDITFRELFWKTWNALGYEFPRDTKHTLMFELSTPSNVVVVPQKESKITFIGARDMDTLDEVDIDNIDLFPEDWKRPQRFDVRSEAEAIAACTKMNPMEQEGFVVTDAKFNRVKMKSPAYAAIAHLGFTKEEIIERGLDLSKYDENTQMKWMLQIIITNECDEFLGYYPQYEKMYRFLYGKFVALLDSMNALYDQVKDINSQWDYAAKVKDHPLSGVYFQLKAGRISSVKEGVRTTDIKKLLKILRAA